MDKPILVVISEPLTPASLKVATLARTLTSGTVYALAQPEDQSALAECGVDQIFVPQGQDYNPLIAAAVAAGVEEAVKQIGQVGGILFSATYLGRAASAMVGVALDAAVAVDVAEVWEQEGTLFGEKSALGGAWNTTFRATSSFPVLALRLGSGSDQEVEQGPAELVELPVQVPATAKAITVEESVPSPAGSGVSLTDASVVVVGGRGVDGDFELVGELAQELGGAVGSTRVACDEGWVDRSTQIGQTGVSIAPDLYIGLGVYGAIHHTSGMMASQVVAVVVDDPDAPIVEMADFAVIGDVAEVVPQALETLRSSQ